MPIPHLKQVRSPKNWRNKKPRIKKRRSNIRNIKIRPKKTKKVFDIRKVEKPSKNILKFLLIILPVFLLKSIRKFWKLIIVFGILGIIFVIIMFVWYSRDLPEPGQLMTRDVAQSTKIYDRTGDHLLYEIHGEQQRTIIPLSEIPEYAVWATLSLEDQQFYQHKGFSLWGMFRGMVINTLKGGRAQGGSTLTQQLVKNAILTNERRISRKIKELILSWQIEKKYSKEEILQMYFNEIPYGSTAYGIEAASYTYFGKNAKDITLGEAAILAALPQRPSYLSPNGSHVDELFGRQHYALNQMVDLGYITPEAAEIAKNEEIDFKQRIEGVIAPHFVFYVKGLLSEKYGEKMVEQGGLKVISTLDYDLQLKAEEILQEQAAKNLENYDASNAALVSIDVKTGQILAMVGSKDFFDDEIDGQVNIVTSLRQPGSSFKPLVYTSSWEMGYVPETVVYDLVTTFPADPKPYTPHNYDSEERGPVSLRKALAGSLNIPAVKMIYLAGISNVLDLSEKLGYTSLGDRSRFGLSLVLGGGEVKLLEHVNAYAAFAREGKFLNTSSILKLEDGNGKLMEEFEQVRATKVMEPNIANITSDVLSDNNARAYAFGENNYLTLGGVQVAAKTGTTNDYRDAWTIGYTTSIATGVWVGNNDNSEMKLGAAGGAIAAPIWQKFMTEINKEYPGSNFNEPSYSIPNKSMLGGEASGIKVNIDSMSGLLASENTPNHLIIEKTFKQAHSILHYVNKNNPLGGALNTPSDDPFYESWESEVVEWALENEVVNELPPTEYDNIHKANDKPNVSFSSPNNNQNISDTVVTLKANANSNRGVVKLEYYLDNTLINTIYSTPYTFNYSIPHNILNGAHRFIVKAYDDLGNVGEAQINFNLERDSYLNINWLEPNTSTTLDSGDFPFNLILYIEEVERVNKIDFYYQLVDSNSSGFLGFTDQVYQNNNQITWVSPPAIGVYHVYPVITDNNNQIFTGPRITISIE
ncbi:hypothetical protein HN800_00940 [bacterium]|jgi:penicillin-binding protein 1C|nr:hypothetical protein [bacterium]MBT4495421.1 hypothetical protein [bacterium]MBT4763646.1 hypothetical protein [bacterium]MBT5401018.1 hypothetical protein [bacterium]MBT5942338.1 hypothetical protein [bacterium]